MSNPNDPDVSPPLPSRGDILREVLPACQPQEGSPANTFTDSELQVLHAQLTDNLQEQLQLEPRSADASKKAVASTKTKTAAVVANSNRVLNICEPWVSSAPTTENPQEESVTAVTAPQKSPSLAYTLPRTFRQAVREGTTIGPTNGVCPGYLQCNLVVLPAGPLAFDFLLFCQRNSKACPLLEVCEGTDSHRPKILAEGSDLRTDVPKYAIYRNGALEQEVVDATDHWPENAVSFLIGCSFSYDGALQNAGIPLRSADAGRNVPMYKTNLACEPAGRLHGCTVVSMKPIHCTKIATEVAITSKYTHAHGGPVCVGCPDAIGIANLEEPEWGDAIELGAEEVPVFHACGVTPQSVLMDSKVPFAITHSAGHMFVTDRPSDMGVL